MNATAAGSIAASVARVHQRVAAACARAGRDPADVTIVAASKTVDVETIREAIGSGISEYGENRVQEALPKIAALAGEPIRWHYIGQLQRNKVRAVAEHFDAIHSVDSAALLTALVNYARRPIDVFLQVNLTGVPGQGGIGPTQISGMLDVAAPGGPVRVCGLMTIGRNTPDPEDSRRVFRQLAALAREHGLAGLSMGMTNDFEVAIEEGATHIRIGRAIFGERAV